MLGNNAIHPNRMNTTRYTLLTFCPLVIYAQLSKPSTLYFFFTLILLSIKSMSPFEPWDYLVAFSIVVGTSILQEGFEDYQRNKEDKEINMAEVLVLRREQRNGTDIIAAKSIFVEDIAEKDVLLIVKDQQIPADVILLKSYEISSSEQGTQKFSCINYGYVETSNLDGETNLKKKEALISQEGERHASICLDRNDGIEGCSCIAEIVDGIDNIDIVDTGDSFDDFDCTLKFSNDEKKRCVYKNVLLRGSSLKKTSYIVCGVVNVGNNTKQARAIKTEKREISSFEKEINWTLKQVFKLYAILMLSITFYGLYYRKYKAIKELAEINTITVIRMLVSNYILFSFLVPLSLFLLIEICKIVHAYRIGRDPYMSVIVKDNDQNGNANVSRGTSSFEENQCNSDAKQIFSRCRNTNVIEDLGMIDYILTDKTGTITENSMEFKLVHTKETGQIKSKSFFNDLLLETNDCDLEKNESTQFYLLLGMLMCNSIEVFDGVYEGISQEELSIMNEVRKYGLLLIKKGSDFIVFEIDGEKHTAKIIGEIEFTSARQRQTVVVEVFGKRILLSKGSDQKLLKEKIDEKAEDIRKTDEEILLYLDNVNEYRVLVYKYALLESKEKKMLDAEIETAEMNGRYAGSVLIEDRLAENIFATMNLLKASNIKLWMVTGDKKETAISCAINSGLATPGNYIAMEGAHLVRLIRDESLSNNCMDVSSASQSTLQISTSNSSNTVNSDSNFSTIQRIINTNSVIIYRANPSQKGALSEALRQKNFHVLAVGDGNNDVAMLKISHVGVGILGKEGRQAVLNADFAIPSFFCLSRLILAHGRYNLIRYSKIFTNSFYKNLFFIFPQYIYSFYSGGSGLPLYNSNFMNFFNLFYTSAIPLSIGLYDKDYEIFKTNTGIYWETEWQKRISQEFDYSNITGYRRARIFFKRSVILFHIAAGILQSIFVFYLVKIFLSQGISNYTGKLLQISGSKTIFTIICFASVISAEYRSVSYVTKYTYFALFSSIFISFFFTFGLNGFNFFNIDVFNSAIFIKIFNCPFTYFAVSAGIILTYCLENVFQTLLCNLYKKLADEVSLSNK